MAEDIKGLIEKIKRDGIEQARQSAEQIEAEAKARAEEILKKAKIEAEWLLQEAQEKITREKASSQALLHQAARDTLIELKKEIERMLGNLICEQIREALSPREIAVIIKELITHEAKNAEAGIEVWMKKSDREALGRSFISELQERVKKEVVLKVSDEIRGGFIISFDRGKSHFDFTDKALAEYISGFLKPKLGKILGV